jgi:TetR/AcrR family transcriptional regulator
MPLSSVPGLPAGWRPGFPVKIRTPSAIEKRRRLRVVAARLFAERGVAATSMQGLAHHAGLGSGRVGAYYDGKEDLLAEVMHDHLAALGLRIDIAAAAEAGGAPEDQLTAMVQAFLEGVQADPASHLVMLQETRSLSASERKNVELRYRLLAHAFGDPLLEAIPALRPRPGAARVVLMSLITLASGSVFWFRPEGTIDVATYARLLVRMTLSGARAMRRRKAPEVPRDEA